MEDIDYLWLLLCAYMVMLMQLGFTLLEVGSVRYKNTVNIMFKNFCDFCLGGIVWYFFGWAITGAPKDGDTNKFMGSGDMFLDSEDYVNWFFSLVFAATAATIVSGAVAERCTIQGYLTYSFVLTAWIYPIVVYWVWSGEGFLSTGKEYQLIDFAGSGVVHMVGGFAALMGAIIIGPRSGPDYKSHATIYQVMGVFILWFGWYGFNCGSTLAAVGQMKTATRVAATTTLAACSAGLGSVLISKMMDGVLSVPCFGNGILAGLVSITANCHVVELWGAILIGLVGAGVYQGSARMIKYFGVDDPLNASPVHGFCGIWGVIAAAIFGMDKWIEEGGYLYNGSMQSRGDIFRNQIVGVLAIASWTMFCSGIMFGILNLTGNLRVDDETEKSGLDMKHGVDPAFHLGTEMVGTNDTKGLNQGGEESEAPVV